MVEGISTNTETALERGSVILQSVDRTIVCTMQTYIVTNALFVCTLFSLLWGGYCYEKAKQYNNNTRV